MKKIQDTNKAFTLIEILVAIAIIGILAGVVLVSMKSYGAKARASKAQAQLASAIPAMISCWGNRGKVYQPDSDGGSDICSLGSSYGQWPSYVGDLSSYDYTSPKETVTTDPDYCALGCIDRDNWYVYVNSSSSNDDRRICCNKKANGCASTIKSAGTTCDNDEWLD
ncbi:MAG: type II secretion system protein [Candidatus Moranbacteria bacterium]|nr:type II secretion system protein [Candidatus Moranbacteria bacterium]